MEGLGVGGGEGGLPGGSLPGDAWAAGPLLPTLAPRPLLLLPSYTLLTAPP